MKNSQHFKKTEIGLIPNDWELKKFSEIFSFLSTGTYSRAQIHEEGDVGYIHYGDIHTKLDFKVDTSKYVSGFVSEIEGKPYARIRQGDLIIADASEDVNGIGKSIEVMNQPANKVISGLHTFLARDIRDTFALGFKGYIDSNILIKKQYIKLASGLKVYSLSKANFDKIWLPIPPLAEQQKIAQALTDADNYISALKELIEKKKMIKEGLIVNLLTGKQRLKEFAFNEDGTAKGYKDSELGKIPEDWEIYKLSEVIWYQEGPGLRNWQFQNQGLKVINVTNLQESGNLDLDKTSRHISWTEFEKMYKHFACDEGDLVMASSGNSYCKISIVRSVDLPLLMNTSVIRFKALRKFSRSFMYVYLGSTFFKSQIDLLITGGAQPNFGPAHLEKIKILAPHNTDEQLKIGKTILDIELDIKEIKKKLNKINSLKQGMMQKLLTGEIRLA